jgi:Matrixin/Putative Ig domain
MKQFCRKLLWLGLILAFSFLTTLPAKATTVVMLSDTDLIVNSRLILTGTVISTTSAWDDTGSTVWTYVEVLIDRMLKGEVPESTIVLKQLGGTVGESGVRVFGQPGFTAGERVLLYLNAGVDGTLHSAHNFMGKFSVVQNPSDGKEFVERSVDAGDVEFLAQTGGGEVTDRAPLSAYVEKIQNTLQRWVNRIAEIESAQSARPLVAVPPEYARKKKQSSGFVPEFVLFAGGVRWMEADQGQAVSYYINPNGAPVAGGASAEIARAMAAWPNQSGASIRLQAAGQTSSCGISVNGVNSISFGDCLNQLDPPVGCTGVVALTGIGFTREPRVIAGVTFNRLIEADTVFNQGMDCFLANSANLAEVACHELGHSIGLAHSTDATAIMWATAHGRGRDATLAADDKTGVLSIYPASAGGGPGPGGGSPVSIATLGLNAGAVSRSYSAILAAAGGTPPYRWNLIGGALPPGLSFSSSGSIDGTPVSANTYSFIVQVSDSGSPIRLDSKSLSITIQSSGGPSLFPVITSVKVKGLKKLWVTGENFSANSLLVVNGVAFDPLSFDQTGSVGQLLVKGKLNFGPAGTNVVIVITASGNSAPYWF